MSGTRGTFPGPSEWVILLGSGLAFFYLLFRARWMPGATGSLLGFALIGSGPLILHALSRRFPTARWPPMLRAFWLLPAMILAHWAMAPIVDSVRPQLLDRHLAHADIFLFRHHPSLWLESRVPAWLTELLLLCYYTYYLWPLLLGAILYARRPAHVYELYRFAIALFFALNLVAYTWVPAVGPRFFLANEFAGPLRGVWLTPWLESAMRGPQFLRDCFPSGHTGLTLVVLAFAWTHVRRFFWLMLPVATGLIAATVVGRFHYVVDLLFAVPLAFGVVRLARPMATRGRSGQCANVGREGVHY